MNWKGLIHRKTKNQPTNRVNVKSINSQNIFNIEHLHVSHDSKGKNPTEIKQKYICCCVWQTYNNVEGRLVSSSLIGCLIHTAVYHIWAKTLENYNFGRLEWCNTSQATVGASCKLD